MLLIEPNDKGASAYPSFSDADAPLQNRMTEMVVEILMAGELEYRRRQINHYEWLVNDRQRLETEVQKRRIEAARKAEEKRLAEIQARRDKLFSQAYAWRAAQDIRAFVAEVQALASSSTLGGATERWACWALAEADALDPIASGQLPFSA